ncbi:YncE family protein [Pseudooceanicola algae]|uniref:Uncharacterized protein n=1 Tax=Pseudooceanicola algae TaxID=1537215 RepID=A0A418SJB7_9RHOB|nr:YncE family protein [Pseudooceanicola algae]QPM91842.1 hypothetical protein PSAL_031040 [Pseudooceanicola algae]
MTPRQTPLRLATSLALAMSLAGLPLTARAQADFPAPAEMEGHFRLTAGGPGQPLHPGTQMTFRGTGFVPGQQITLQRGTYVLTGDAPLVADEAGEVTLDLTLPQAAAVGMHPIVVLAENPSATELLDLKISPEIPLSGSEAFEMTSVASPTPGLYQIAHSDRAKALFVTASSFRPNSSTLMKLDPETLETIASITPAPYADTNEDDGENDGEQNPYATGPASVFGLGLDDSHGHVWATNTASNSVAVYDQDDLSLVHQFPQGQVYHSREVIVDEVHSKAYVTSSATARVHVFDTETLEPLEVIEIPSSLRGEDFYVMNSAIDAEGGRLFVSSRATSELAVIDLESRGVTSVFALPGAIHATGIAFDATSGRVFVSGQGSDNVLIVDPDAGKVLHTVPVGAGALSISFDPAGQLAWVTNRGAGTISAVDAQGHIVATLDLGSYPNDVTSGPDGTVYAVNKSFGADDPRGDLITAIRPR